MQGMAELLSHSSNCFRGTYNCTYPKFNPQWQQIPFLKKEVKVWGKQKIKRFRFRLIPIDRMAIWIAYQNFWTSTFMSSDIGCFEHEQDKLVSKCCFFFLLSKKSFWKLQSASDKKSLSIWVFRISCLQTCWRNFFWKSKKPRWHTYPFKFTRNLCKLENNILISFSRMNCTLANESKHLQRHR